MFSIYTIYDILSSVILGLARIAPIHGERERRLIPNFSLAFVKRRHYSYFVLTFPKITAMLIMEALNGKFKYPG